MVLMAAASGHRHRRAAKSSATAIPVTPSPPPAAKSSVGAGLLGFSFSWGAQRRLRCSKDGAPAYASPSPSPSPPTQHPHTPSLDKENPKPLPQGDGDGARTGSSRPQRPRNLRPLRYAASSRLDGAAHQAALKSPSPSAQARPGKRAFAVALSKEEIARDFAAIRGGRLPRRGKKQKEKRKKEVQKKIDKLFPGSELAKIDLDNYIEERGLR